MQELWVAREREHKNLSLVYRLFPHLDPDPRTADPYDGCSHSVLAGTAAAFL